MKVLFKNPIVWAALILIVAVAALTRPLETVLAPNTAEREAATLDSRGVTVAAEIVSLDQIVPTNKKTTEPIFRQSSIPSLRNQPTL